MDKRANKRKTKDDDVSTPEKKNKGKRNVEEEPAQIVNKNQKTASVGDWNQKDTVLIKDFGTNPSNKILSFDLDDTLIKTTSGKKFAENQNDWKIFSEKVPSIIQKYNNEGYKIVIFTNQGGISKGKTDKKSWTTKVNNIQKLLNVPIQVFAATESDYYRKPCVGMWEIMRDEFNGNVAIDLSSSIYVGDAAGRPKTKDKGKDFSDSDHKFAVNVGIGFQTPEMFFLGEKESLPKFEFNPKSLIVPNQTIFKGINNKDESAKLKPNGLEMIVFVGSPGSGKSTFYHNYLKANGYVHVNQDQLKDFKKVLKVAEETLKKGQSVVIDSTNPAVDKRKSYLDVANKCNAIARCFFFNFTKELAMHCNESRSFNKYRNHHTKDVADVIIHTWYKNLAPPTVKEGFKEVLEVNFVPGPFADKDDERTFFYYS